jgi:hypothetical protein
MEAKLIEFTACAECESQEPIGKTNGGLDPLFICPDCGTVEGATRRLLINEETDEVTPVCRIVDGLCQDYTGKPGTNCPDCGKGAFND